MIGALGVVTTDFRKFIERLEVPAKLEVTQKTALLGTARILEPWLLVVTCFHVSTRFAIPIPLYESTDTQ